MLTADWLNDAVKAEAESILARYYPLDRYPAKARSVLEELLDASTG